MSENNSVATIESPVASKPAAQVATKTKPAKAKKPATKPATAAKTKPAKGDREHRSALSLPQIRVLAVLNKSNGPLTRSRISEKCGNKTTVVVGRAVGYSDPKARKAFENTKDGGFRPSLLTLQMVKEVEVDVDGRKETGLIATAKGKAAFAKLGKVKLPELRD